MALWEEIQEALNAIRAVSELTPRIGIDRKSVV